MPLWMTGGRHVSPTAIPGLVDDESSRQRLMRLVSDICALVR